MAYLSDVNEVFYKERNSLTEEKKKKAHLSWTTSEKNTKIESGNFTFI